MVWPAAAQDQGRIETTDGRVIEGQVEQRGDRYLVQYWYKVTDVWSRPASLSFPKSAVTSVVLSPPGRFSHSSVHLRLKKGDDVMRHDAVDTSWFVNDRFGLFLHFNFQPKTPGFGFPVRFMVEASDDPDSSQAKVIRDETGAPFPNPGGTVVSFAAGDVQARYIRVSAFELWASKPGAP